MKLSVIILLTIWLFGCAYSERVKTLESDKGEIVATFTENHGHWQGPDGFPVTGYELTVRSKIAGLQLIDDYRLLNKHHEPNEVFNVVGNLTDGICLKWYNRLDFYLKGKGTTLLKLNSAERIADMTLIGDSVFCQCMTVKDEKEWGHITPSMSTRIIRIPVDNPVAASDVVSIKHVKPTPYLQAMAWKFNYYTGFVKGTNLAIISDGDWVYTYDMANGTRKNVYKVVGEIWKCMVQNGVLYIEDRDYDAVPYVTKCEQFKIP